MLETKKARIYFKLEPELYKECLQLIARRDGLDDSFFIPAQMAEIISIEEELEMSLPRKYQEYLLRVGVGHEHGGLAVWYHLDVGKSGNVLEKRAKAAKQASNFLPIYDSLDGEVFGFCQNGKGFIERVFCLDQDEEVFEEAYSDFSSFLKNNLDCTEEEIEQAKLDIAMRKI